MRDPSLIFVVVLFLTACGSKGGLYLPEGETEEVQPVSIDQETFQPENPEQELENRAIPQDEEENE